MKTIYGFLVLVVFLATNAYTYETQADEIDMQQLMSNDKKSLDMLHCLMKKKTCDKIGQKELDILQEAVTTECRLCKDYQKTRMKQFFFNVQTKFPEDFANFRQKYDPENIHMDKFLKYISQY